MKASKALKGTHQAAAASLPRTTERFQVEGLDCGECGTNIRTGLRQLAGVQAINVNVAAQEIAVTFDPNRVQPDAIRVQLEQLGVGCR